MISSTPVPARCYRGLIYAARAEFGAPLPPAATMGAIKIAPMLGGELWLLPLQPVGEDGREPTVLHHPHRGDVLLRRQPQAPSYLRTGGAVVALLGRFRRHRDPYRVDEVLITGDLPEVPVDDELPTLPAPAPSARTISYAEADRQRGVRQLVEALCSGPAPEGFGAEPTRVARHAMAVAP